MKKIAVPITNGSISQHFGHCEEFYIYDIKNDTIGTKNIAIPPPHEPGMLPKWLSDMGVTDIIAVGMGTRAIGLFTQNKINVFIGVPIKDPDDLVFDLINGTLETSDNTCDH